MQGKIRRHGTSHGAKREEARFSCMLKSRPPVLFSVQLLCGFGQVGPFDLYGDHGLDLLQELLPDPLDLEQILH